MKTVAQALSGSGIEPYEARMLLAHATGMTRVALVAHPEAVLDAAQDRAFEDAAARRRAGEPLAYLIGEREFYGLSLGVTADVLIPRPETELLVDFALEALPEGGALLDLGTGSGAIALAVKSERPDARVTAVDLSRAALAVARENAVRHGLDVEFLEGNWFEPLAMRRFDLIASNPPYVAEGDPHLREGDVRFEPGAALVAGADGLAAIRIICAQACTHLEPGGWLCLEHGLGQESDARSLLEDAGLAAPGARRDLAGIMRIAFGRMPG